MPRPCAHHRHPTPAQRVKEADVFASRVLAHALRDSNPRNAERIAAALTEAAQPIVKGQYLADTIVGLEVFLAAFYAELHDALHGTPGGS